MRESDRKDFIATMKLENVPEHIASLVMRHAATIQRLAVAACERNLTRQEELTDKQCEVRIIELLAPYNVKPVFSGDPRGACVKLRVPSGRTDDWGHVGVCVPTPEF